MTLFKLLFQFSKSRPLKQIYLRNIEETAKFKDARQLQILESFQRLTDQIINSHAAWERRLQSNEGEEILQKQHQQQQKRNFFFMSYPNIVQKKVQTKSISTSNVRGIYLYGSSGCGKTFLSEMFFNNLQIKQKLKIHFHEFMGTVQKDLFQLQQQKLSFDPLTTIANRRSKQYRLLFLDEFQVTDVADASILKRLFEKLINNNVILVATSNRQPDELYKNGHQREHFVPFISFLKEKCQILYANSQKDYRYDMQVDTSPTTRSYLSPIDDITDKKLDQIFMQLAHLRKFQYQQKSIQVMEGRSLKVPRTKNGVCIYYFDQLCDNVMGDSDFRAICKNHQAIILKNVPKISTHNRNIANRFIKLLDQIYVNKVKLYCNAEVGLQEIIKVPETVITEEDFAITRCKSRLVEFQAKKYKEEVSFWQANQ